MSKLPGIILIVVALLLLWFVVSFARGGSFRTVERRETRGWSSTLPTTGPGVVVVPVAPPSPSPAPQGSGVIAGHLDIGPICPVERVPADPNCAPGPQHYASYKMVAYNASRTAVIKQAAFDAQGNYRLDLPSGTYIIDIAPHSPDGPGSASGVPVQVVLRSGGQVRVDVSVDTGIR